MNQTTIWQEITSSVHQAVRERLDLLPEEGLVERSDSLLSRLPSIEGSQPISTGLFLRRYHAPLHLQVCQGTHPRTSSSTVEDELRDLTRAIILTVGVTEGISVEAAVGLALVLYKQGIIPFCALPVPRIATA